MLKNADFSHTSSGSKSQILDMSKVVQTPEAFIEWPLLKEPMSAMKAFKSHDSLNLWCHNEETCVVQHATELVTIQNVRLGI